MKFNPIVVLGAVVVIASSWNLPAMTYTVFDLSQQASHRQGSFNEGSGIIAGITILIIMLSSWKWRGFIWIALSLAGAIWMPVATLSLYDVYAKVWTAGFGTLTLKDPYWGAGVTAVMVGYAIVVAGSIWDIAQKRKRQPSPAPQVAPKPPMLVPETSPLPDSPTERLKRLKELLDQSLISQQDYETKKAEILSKM